jgi:hypothetical protein
MPFLILKRSLEFLTRETVTAGVATLAVTLDLGLQ